MLSMGCARERRLTSLIVLFFTGHNAHKQLSHCCGVGNPTTEMSTILRETWRRAFSSDIWTFLLEWHLAGAAAAIGVLVALTLLTYLLSWVTFVINGLLDFVATLSRAKAGDRDKPFDQFGKLLRKRQNERVINGFYAYITFTLPVLMAAAAVLVADYIGLWEKAGVARNTKGFSYSFAGGWIFVFSLMFAVWSVRRDMAEDIGRGYKTKLQELALPANGAKVQPEAEANNR